MVSYLPLFSIAELSSLSRQGNIKGKNEVEFIWRNYFTRNTRKTFLRWRASTRNGTERCETYLGGGNWEVRGVIITPLPPFPLPLLPCPLTSSSA